MHIITDIFVFRYTQKCRFGEWKRGLGLESLQLIDHMSLNIT